MKGTNMNRIIANALGWAVIIAVTALWAFAAAGFVGWP